MVRLFACIAFYGLLWSWWTYNPHQGVGLVAWVPSKTQAESNERIRQDRVGPLVCLTYYERPLWRRVIQRTDSWCPDWLDRQALLAQG